MLKKPICPKKDHAQSFELLRQGYKASNASNIHAGDMFYQAAWTSWMNMADPSCECKSQGSPFIPPHCFESILTAMRAYSPATHKHVINRIRASSAKQANIAASLTLQRYPYTKSLVT
jgi:hypothetical protein